METPFLESEQEEKVHQIMDQSVSSGAVEDAGSVAKNALRIHRANVTKILRIEPDSRTK